MKVYVVTLEFLEILRSPFGVGSHELSSDIIGVYSDRIVAKEMANKCMRGDEKLLASVSEFNLDDIKNNIESPCGKCLDSGVSRSGEMCLCGLL